ncbi:hypothetical protein GW17_00060555, partial [Ensete ventricosum]
SDVQEIPIEEARGALEASRKRRGGDSASQKKKGRQSHGGKRARRHLGRASSPKTKGQVGEGIQSGEPSTTYIRGVLLPRLASDLYILPSEVLMDGAAKAMVLNQHYQAALFNRVHDAGHVITSLDGKMSLLRQELQDLKDGENPDAVAAVEVRAVEAQSVAERLRIELDEANSRRASTEAELERTRSASASLET